MTKQRKAPPSVPSPIIQPRRGGNSPKPYDRLASPAAKQAANRWQRTKRYGWDSR